jgi:hypothetical protein
MAVAVTVVLVLSFASAASAQDDPPGRVARLNFIEGSVSFQPAGTQDWVDANPNRPLTTGDNLWADENSRSELHIDATAVRLSAQTGISILNLNDATAQIQLAQGTIDVRVREIGDGEAYEVDTPNMAFSLLRPGEYRISVDPNGTTSMVTVRGGAGEATAGGAAYPVNPGQEAIFSGTDQVSYDVQGAPGPDSFDEWCTARDMREDHSMSARYVSRDMIGYEDPINMGTGSRYPTTATCGYQTELPTDGLPIITAIGFPSSHGDGRGSKTSRGDSLPSTTVGGQWSAADGSGFPDRSRCGQCMPQLW